MHRRLIVALTILACLITAAPAGALVPRQVFGIGNTSEFSDPRLQALKPAATRLLTPWHAALHKGYERERVDNWYRLAIAAGLDPLLSFQGSSRRAPSVSRYQQAFRAALRRWPRIGEWQTWNEANHSSQSITWRHPERAARYAKAMEQACPRCTVLPITIVLSNQRGTQTWLKSFLKAYGKTPKIWAVHDYGNVNRGDLSRMRAFLNSHPQGRVWVTEAGAWAKFGDDWPYNLARQERFAPVSFQSALRFRSRVDRLYWWEWRGRPDPRRAHWDTGLINVLGKPRPAYFAALRARFRSP